MLTHMLTKLPLCSIDSGSLPPTSLCRRSILALTASLQSRRTGPPCTSVPDDTAIQPSSESLQPTQSCAELSPPSLRAIVAARTTPQPSVVAAPAGPGPTALAFSDQRAGAQGTECSTSSPTRHKSLDAVKAVGVVESWQVLNADADILTVWDKYEEVFFGDYHPLFSTCRR